MNNLKVSHLRIFVFPKQLNFLKFNLRKLEYTKISTLLVRFILYFQKIQNCLYYKLLGSYKYSKYVQSDFLLRRTSSVRQRSFIQNTSKIITIPCWNLSNWTSVNLLVYQKMIAVLWFAFIMTILHIQKATEHFRA